MTTTTNFLKRVDTKSANFLPAFVLASAAFALLSLLLHAVVLGSVTRLESKPTPRLVETADGTTIEAEALEYGDHSNESIKAWVAETMYGLYDWRGILPPKTAEEVGSPKSDPGNPIELEKRDGIVTTATWNTSWRLSEDFRKQFLRKMAGMTPEQIFSNPGSYQASLVPRLIGIPERTDKGEWIVTYQGFLVVLSNGDNVGEAIPINKRLHIRHVDTPVIPANATDMQKTIYQARKDELEIYQIQDLPRS